MVQDFNPISDTSRIEIVDILRGFALLGVLLANVPFDHTMMEDSHLDVLLSSGFDLFINRKFITLFSMLFGFGFHIQMIRAQNRGVDFTGYFLKRMGLLFLIGTIHCFFLWHGDILMSYAFGGVFLLVVKSWSVRKLTQLAIFFCVFLTGMLFIGNTVLGWQTHNYDVDLIRQFPLAESYVEYISINFQIAPWINFIQDMPVTLVFTFGNMVVGLVLGKLGFFLKPGKLKWLTNGFIILGFSVGLLSSYLFHLVNTERLQLDVSLVWLPFLVIAGMLLQTLGYVAVFIKLGHTPLFKKLFSWFKYVGRTALSNYILQSVFYLLAIFHAIDSYGLYGKIARAETYLLAGLFFALQSFLSDIWLRKHHQGPIEYLWKKMSYGGWFKQIRNA
ncbi:DUF418 domain-containing protein [Ulvibacterium sp.]|uniref:DUF418 domain-containing protein n=1 Tax=Ulvibacterium sp. TaxID=2665914 RepID=UPI003BA8D089